MSFQHRPDLSRLPELLRRSRRRRLSIAEKSPAVRAPAGDDVGRLVPRVSASAIRTDVHQLDLVLGA
ncbi:hypothetical protein Y025_5586 [Burkholderia pseudomallei TSV32]|nr:hypothetical protein Y025_5586 [Burkholderia pseudomallei TSV32]